MSMSRQDLDDNRYYQNNILSASFDAFLKSELRKANQDPSIKTINPQTAVYASRILIIKILQDKRRRGVLHDAEYAEKTLKLIKTYEREVSYLKKLDRKKVGPMNSADATLLNRNISHAYKCAATICERNKDILDVNIFNNIKQAIIDRVKAEELRIAGRESTHVLIDILSAMPGDDIQVLPMARSVTAPDPITTGQTTTSQPMSFLSPAYLGLNPAVLRISSPRAALSSMPSVSSQRQQESHRESSMQTTSSAGALTSTNTQTMYMPILPGSSEQKI